jgi:hypothetical protein
MFHELLVKAWTVLTQVEPSTRTPRRFRPELGGCGLESRMVLSTSMTSGSMLAVSSLTTSFATTSSTITITPSNGDDNHSGPVNPGSGGTPTSDQPIVSGGFPTTISPTMLA